LITIETYWNEYYSEDLNLELETKIAKAKNWTQIMIKQQKLSSSLLKIN